jgi:hypothetical protein
MLSSGWGDGTCGATGGTSRLHPFGIGAGAGSGGSVRGRTAMAFGACRVSGPCGVAARWGAGALAGLVAAVHLGVGVQEVADQSCEFLEGGDAEGQAVGDEDGWGAFLGRGVFVEAELEEDLAGGQQGAAAVVDEQGDQAGGVAAQRGGVGGRGRVVGGGFGLVAHGAVPGLGDGGLGTRAARSRLHPFGIGGVARWGTSWQQGAGGRWSGFAGAVQETEGGLGLLGDLRFGSAPCAPTNSG